MPYQDQQQLSPEALAEHEYQRADRRAHRALTHREFVEAVRERNRAARTIWACALKSFEEGAGR